MFSIEVRESPGKGRGVFATKDFEEDEVIEICPVRILDERETQLIQQTALTNDYYYWGETEAEGRAAILWGYGCLYNHSYEPNIYYKPILTERVFVFRALRKILAGEELCSNYNRDPDSKKPLDPEYKIAPHTPESTDN